jgi:hypothetical protein
MAPARALPLCVVGTYEAWSPIRQSLMRLPYDRLPTWRLRAREVGMRPDAHRQRALQLEHAIAVLGDPAVDPDISISLIESYWGAYGCLQKHGRHKE